MSENKKLWENPYTKKVDLDDFLMRKAIHLFVIYKACNLSILFFSICVKSYFSKVDTTIF